MQKYGHESYKNLSEDKKQKLVEDRKIYYQMKKRPYYNYKHFNLEKNFFFLELR